MDQAVQDCSCTADAGIDFNRFEFTIVSTGSAFNTVVQVDETGFFILDKKDISRADFYATLAPGTFLREIFKGYYTGQVFHKIFQVLILYRTINTTDKTDRVM